jgi:hypothetical protein
MLTRCKCFFLVLFLSSFLSKEAWAQPQWKFYIAFEDGIGARDTIWLIWDTTAHGTLPTDTALGEAGVNFNYSAFNVWVYNYDNDSTKTSALPYSAYPAHGVEVRAFNYQLPLTIRWDSSLFHAPYLPPLSPNMVKVARIDNDYFFFVNNSPINHYFDMLLDNNVSAPAFNWFSQSQFPMYFTLSFDTITGIPDLESKSISFFPNPVYDYLKISCLEKIESVEIYNSLGSRVYQDNNIKDRSSYDVNISDKPDGIYFLKVNTVNESVFKKVIKAS